MSSSDFHHCVVFDLDGVLADTRELVREAYRDVGVEMPPDAWGKPWTRWLPSALAAAGYERGDTSYVHRLKDERYRAMLTADGVASRITLPPARVALELIEDGERRVFVVTASSGSSARVILDVLGFPSTYAVDHELSATGRVDGLAQLSRSTSNRSVIYVDDLPEGKDIAGQAGVSFVRYSSQTEHELRAELEELWMSREA